jgi:hypothetical protein
MARLGARRARVACQRRRAKWRFASIRDVFEATIKSPRETFTDRADERDDQSR